MKLMIAWFLTFSFLFGTGTFARSDVPTKNNIQLAVLLDTSNSMDGLIEQAKTTLWKIVNELAIAKKGEAPVQLEVALYEYGNDGLPSSEGFIRQVSPLTTDLDRISEELFKLKTNGGSEFCGQVIDNATKTLQWSRNNNDLKLIFIAGNEPFTQGQVNYKDSCKAAITKGIIVNTIFCGNFQEGINTAWKDGADRADGKYMNIDQNTHIVHIAAPQDAELARLGDELNKTYIAYGSMGQKKKERQMAQDSNARSLGSAVMADRAAAKASKHYKNESWDLIDAQEEGVVELEKISEEDLPTEMKGMTTEERQKYINEQKEKRSELEKQIQKLQEDRRRFIAEKSKDQKNTLDDAIIEAIHEQARTKDYSFSH